MSKEDRNTALTIGIVLVVSLVSLVVILNSLLQLASPTLTFIGSLIGNTTRAATVNYNFNVDQETDDIIVQEQDEEQTVAAEVPQPENMPENLNYNFAVPTAYTETNYYDVDSGVKEESFLQDASSISDTGEIDSGIANDAKILIPKIGVNSPVVQGFDGDALLDQGFWVSPSSFKIDQGEVMMLCHRRYFGPNDPRSCWYLDRLQRGDEIIVQNGQQQLRYEIRGTNIFEAGHPLIYQTSDLDQYLRIVTCSPLGTDTHRLVVLAEQVS